MTPRHAHSPPVTARIMLGAGGLRRVTLNSSTSSEEQARGAAPRDLGVLSAEPTTLRLSAYSKSFCDAKQGRKKKTQEHEPALFWKPVHFLIGVCVLLRRRGQAAQLYAHGKEGTDLWGVLNWSHDHKVRICLQVSRNG